MICEKCGYEVGPEQLKCPHCGADNPFAIKHEENMREYGKKYDATEKEVKGFGKSVEGLGKRAAILAVLLVGSIAMIIAAAIISEGPDEEAAVKRDSAKNAVAYAEEADELLSRGEYMEYASFMYSHELMFNDLEEFDRFGRLNYVVEDYRQCIILMEEMILRSDDPDYYDGLDSDIKNFCTYLNAFYESFEAQKEYEKNEEYQGYILDMEEDLQAAMRTYFQMDEETLREFMELSSAQKAVKIQEVLRNE